MRYNYKNKPKYTHGNNKYGAQKTNFDGKTFDSMHEQRRHQELILLERGGKIRGLRTQVEYELIPAQYESYERISEKTGKKLKDGQRCIEHSCKYIADFVYQDCDTGRLVVEDAKGMKTEAYKIKKKLMLHVHGIRIHEV